MNELLLRDVGAPEWMVARAAARRDAEGYVNGLDRLRGSM